MITVKGAPDHVFACVHAALCPHPSPLCNGPLPLAVDVPWLHAHENGRQPKSTTTMNRMRPFEFYGRLAVICAIVARAASQTVTLADGQDMAGTVRQIPTSQNRFMYVFFFDIALQHLFLSYNTAHIYNEHTAWIDVLDS